MSANDDYLVTMADEVHEKLIKKITRDHRLR